MKKWLFLIVLLPIVCLLGGGVYGWWVLQPVAPAQTDTQTFVIPKGQAISVIGERLAVAGLVRQPLAFRLWVKLQDVENQIQAGSFELSPSMSLSEVATNLTKGTNDLWITLPEGWRNEEVAEYLDAQDLPEFDKEAFLALASASQGQLFPETYLVPKLATTEQLYQLLTRTYETKIIDGLSQEIANSEYRLEDALIMASLVEREAANAKEMPEVAGVLWKRIELGMPLQVDATLQYIKGYNAKEKSWWSPPLAADKAIVSPFNTYLHPGLPPRPISNPGLEAIRASLKPVKSNNLFYIHDASGKIHFAKTLEQHNQNVQQYLR